MNGVPKQTVSKTQPKHEFTTLKVRSFKSINEKKDGPNCGFDYLSLFSDPIDLTTWSLRELLYFFATFNRVVDTKTSINQRLVYTKFINLFIVKFNIG